MSKIQSELAASVVAELPTLLTIAEAARVLRVSTRTVHRFLAARRLQAVRLGPTRVLIPRLEIERMLIASLSG